MAQFTAETAADMAKRSHEIRKARLELATETRLAEEQAALFAMTDTQKALSRTRTQIEKVDEALDNCDDAREWDALTRAKERLFRAWVHLAGIPGPGQRKPAPEPARRKVYSDAGPTAIAPTTTQSVPAPPEVISNPKPLSDNKTD